MKMEEISIEDIPEIETGKGIDVEEYSGLKKKIEKISVLNVTSHFTEDGKYDEKVNRKVKVLKIETEPVTTIKTKDNKEVPVKGSELFNMKQGEDGTWGISTSPRSKIKKFMNKQKVASLKVLVGTTVMLKSNTDQKTGNTYLGFVTE
jgi:hypothetical protein